MSINDYTEKYRNGNISGSDLGDLVNKGIISKSDRRKITKLGRKPIKELSSRQQLRLEVKAKKSLPRLTKDDRHQKYVVDKNDSIREKKQQVSMVCLGCRQIGHILKYCPEDSTLKRVFCFNCNGDHALRCCPEPKTPGYLPFAECFICKAKGHIARDCLSNPNGLYPHGGCCHICMKKDHLVKDCPMKDDKSNEREDERGGVGGELRLPTRDDLADKGDDYLEFAETAAEAGGDAEDTDDAQISKKKRKKQRV